MSKDAELQLFELIEIPEPVEDSVPKVAAAVPALVTVIFSEELDPISVDAKVDEEKLLTSTARPGLFPVSVMVFVKLTFETSL